MSEPRVLMLLPSDPLTRDSGARIRNAGLLGLLRERFHIDTLIAPARRRSTASRVRDLLISDRPDMAHRLWSPELTKAVREGEYDVVQAEGIEMARYLENVPMQRRVYDAHNAEFLLQRRVAQTSTPIRGAYSRIQWRRLVRFEGGVVRSSRLTMTVSEHDANQLIALGGPEANVHVIPNGIDVAAYAFRAPSSAVSTSLLFVGKLDFRPNAEAVAWFLRSVLPRLPDARLFAVGAAPPRWLVSAGQHDPRVAVTDYVTDERPYFARSAALILPVWTGGGSRLKALVAMASGLPIISTALGMEGLEAEPSIHFLRAESVEDWVAAVQQVSQDRALRERLAANARDLVQQRYDWSALRPRLEAAYAWLGR